MKHTRIALEEYDRTAPERALLWANCSTDYDLAFIEELEERARVKVCEAFYADTSHINSLDKCLLLHPGPPISPAGQELSFIRRMAAR